MALLTRTQDRGTKYIDSDPDTKVVARDHAHPMTIVARIISFITSAILAILAVRFVFVLLGANPANGIANFVYNVSEPFVSPFFTLFNYEFVNGTARFEGFTLVAMLIYALVGYGLARLMTIGRPVREEV
jgi:YggT family protein